MLSQILEFIVYRDPRTRARGTCAGINGRCVIFATTKIPFSPPAPRRKHLQFLDTGSIDHERHQKGPRAGQRHHLDRDSSSRAREIRHGHRVRDSRDQCESSCRSLSLLTLVVVHYEPINPANLNSRLQPSTIRLWQPTAPETRASPTTRWVACWSGFRR
jgi:hypothetical protein